MHPIILTGDVNDVSGHLCKLCLRHFTKCSLLPASKRNCFGLADLSAMANSGNSSSDRRVFRFVIDKGIELGLDMQEPIMTFRFVISIGTEFSFKKFFALCGNAEKDLKEVSIFAETPTLSNCFCSHLDIRSI